MIATQLAFPFMEKDEQNIPVHISHTVSYVIVSFDGVKLMFIEHKMQKALAILGEFVRSGTTNLSRNQMKKLKDAAWS